MLIIIPLIFSCAGGSASPWKAYIFDGITFSPTTDSNSKTIWLRSGHFPIVAELPPAAALSDVLPPGTGAVAGICFSQTSGNKTSTLNPLSPYTDEQITFKSAVDGVAVTRTDKNGYFIEYLPAGEYELFCRGVKTTLRIKPGETTLIPIRGGKRMAD